MYRLLSILSNYRNTILFVILEGIAIFMIVSYNDHQRQLMGDTFLDTRLVFQDASNSVSDYFNLRYENRQLQDESKILYKRVDSLERLVKAYESRVGVDSITTAISERMLAKESFDYIPCRVIKSTTHKNYNYLSLNKGAEDGVTPGMGVISPKGIAGKVIRVGKQYSLALSALNVGFKLTLQAIDHEGEMVEGNVGVYVWNGGDPRYAFLTIIPETVNLEVGYEVVTSGNSTVFPAGFKVGTIYSKDEAPQDGFHNARIKLATDFNSLGNVYLLAARHKTAMDSLEVNLPEE